MKIHFNKDFWRDGFFYIYLLLLFLWIAPFSDGSLPLDESLLCIFFIIFTIGSMLAIMFDKD